jgi:riboflavin kinase
MSDRKKARLSEIKASYLPTLLELLVEGAKDKPVSITTTELAAKLGKSQQLASKHLEEMENDGLVERIRSGRRTFIKLTRKGIATGESLHSTLDRVFGAEEEQELEITGEVFSGLGEAAYYVSIKGYRNQFKSKLGFDPFPGTLNLRLESPVDRKIRRDLSTIRGIHIDGFSDGRRTYGGAECFRARVEGKVEAAVLAIERTTHDDSVLEIISPVNIRRQFGLKDGNKIHVTIRVSNSKSA